jgi:hypothetical protein
MEFNLFSKSLALTISVYVDICHERNVNVGVVLYPNEPNDILDSGWHLFPRRIYVTNIKNAAGRLIAVTLFPLAMAGCGGESVVSFSQDVNPILEKNCFECHQAGGKGELASGFNMTSYDSLMKGTRFGPMIIAGDAEGSNMLVLMEGRADPSISMPHGRQKTIAKEDIQTIRVWIKQGAKNN